MAQCSNCGHLNPDDAAFCSACGTRLSYPCPNCSAPYAPGSAYCSTCGTRLDAEAADDDGDDGRDDLTRYVPAELLEKLHEARRGRAMAGERRMVTMLFADVQGSTAAAEQLDPEEWADIINGAFERLIRPVYRYEGTLARLMGDAVLAFFGAPIAHEDDPERAVRAGLAMLADAGPYAREVRARWGVDFGLRVGINTGLVVVGEVGSDLRVEYTALGDAVNLAARMEQTAEPGTLQITADTQRLVSSLFEFEELAPIEVKGKSDPVPAYRVTGIRERPATTRGLEGTRAPLVGRDAELASLREVVDDVRLGKGRVCTIIGEAGVGKSRLMASLKEDLDAIECIAPWRDEGDASTERVRWAEARCLSYDASVPYAPFVDLFTRMFALDGQDDDEVARQRISVAVEHVLAEGADAVVPYLCVMLGLDPGHVEGLVIADLPSPALQRRIFGAVVSYFEACTTARPGMLVLEDLHWADSVSLALLEEVMRITDRSSLGVVALMRPYRDDASWKFHESAERTLSHRYTPITLEPLGADAARQMLDEIVGDGVLPAGLEASILAKADGNPFFVEEIVRGLIEAGALSRRAGEWVVEEDVDELSIPNTVSGLLTARLDRLDGSSKLVTQLASVLGREFEFGELAELVGEADAADAAVADLLRRDLIVERRRIPTREYAFRHALIQEAAYSTILLKDRRSLHSRIAEHLIGRGADDPQEIARHLVGSRQERRAVPYLVEAADRAVRSMSLADAIRFYLEALKWADDEEDAALVTRAHDGMGTAYSLIPDLTQASASYQQLLEFGRARSEPSVQITALNRLGVTSAFLGGNYEAAASYLEDARRIAEETGDEMGLAEYHMNSCLIATTQGDMERAAAHDAETARLGSALGSTEVHLGGLLQRTLSLLYGAQFDEGKRALEQAKRIAAGVDDPGVRAGLASAEYLLLLRDGRLGEAWEQARSAAELSAGVGSSRASVLALQAGGVAALLGEYEHALAFLGESLRLGEEVGQLFNAAAAAASMIHIYAELGVDAAELSHLSDKTLPYVESPSGAMLASTVHAELGWAALAGGRLDEAAISFERGLGGTSASKQLELPSLQLGLATARLRSGDGEDAAALLAAASEFVARHGIAHYRPAIAAVRGAVALSEGTVGEAAAVLGDGIAAAEAMGMAPIEWKLRAARAGALAADGEPQASADELAAARDVVATLAGSIIDDAMRRSFLRVTATQLSELSDVGA